MADITNTNRERYYHLFTPKPYGPTPMLVVNQLYKCWNEQYNTAFDSITSKIGPTQMFASFHGPHAKAVGELAGILIENIDMEDPSNMQAIEFFDYIRRRGDIHPQLFVSALPMALVSTRSSLIGEPTPPLVEMFPSRFLPRVVEGPEIKLSAQSGRGTNKVRNLTSRVLIKFSKIKTRGFSLQIKDSLTNFKFPFKICIIFGHNSSSCVVYNDNDVQYIHLNNNFNCESQLDNSRRP